MSTAPSGWQAPKTNWLTSDPIAIGDLNRAEGNSAAIETGSRTLDQALASPANAGTLRQILSWFAGRIHAITGAANWHDAPAATIAAIWAKFHASTGHSHSGTTNDAPNVPWANVSSKPSSFTPAAHKTSHESGGSDALALGSIAGTLTDSQHGNRGGGTLHALAVADGLAGFLSGIDKAKLDSLGAVNQQTFTASDTWIKPTGVNWVLVDIISGGAGGRTGQISSTQDGGAGGAGGGRVIRLLPASVLGATEAVMVGAGGSANQAGGNSVFAGITVLGGGTHTYGGGPGGGIAYATTAASPDWGISQIGGKEPTDAGVGARPGEWGGASGSGRAVSAAGPPNTGGVSLFGGGGGGQGGNGSADNTTARNGGAGGAVLTYDSLGGGGGAGGALSNGSNGADGDVIKCGQGGGGGSGRFTSGQAWNGGNGGVPGGGGGGGGTARSTGPAGTGGSGGRGEVRIYSWR